MTLPHSHLQDVPPSPNDEPLWYALRPEVRSGALRTADLRHLAQTGQLKPDDFIWQAGWPQWERAYSITGLFMPPPVAASPLPATSMPAAKGLDPSSSIHQRVKHELRSYLIITLYVWGVLALLRFHESLIAEAYALDIPVHGFLLVKALIFGKVVLVADALRLGERIGQHAPAFIVLIKSLLCGFALVLFHMAEHSVVALWNGQPMEFDLPPGSGANFKRGLTYMGMMTLTLIPYYLIKEIERRTGAKDLMLIAIGLKR